MFGIFQTYLKSRSFYGTSEADCESKLCRLGDTIHAAVALCTFAGKLKLFVWRTWSTLGEILAFSPIIPAIPICD